MRSDDLTQDQARALKNKLAPMLGCLNRLKKRMTYRGFTHDDKLLQAVCRAEMAMHDLHVATHYLACGDVAGAESRFSNSPVNTATLVLAFTIKSGERFCGAPGFSLFAHRGMPGAPASDEHGFRLSSIKEPALL